MSLAQIAHSKTLEVDGDLRIVVIREPYVSEILKNC